MKWSVPLSDVTIGEEEVCAASEVLRSGWLTQAGQVEAFENAFARELDARHAIAVNNGTAALHLAYATAGLGRDDEFLVPALTFVATMNAGLYCGAKPVLVDCTSEDDLTLSVEDVERKITPRTRLIVAMAYGGYCPDMIALRDLAKERGIALVEDACHAPLARLDGRAIGTFGRAGAFSLFSNKNLTTGEGGLVVTDDDEMASRMRLLRSHGMTTLTWDRHRGHAADYDVVELGYNYRLDEVRAAIGIEQLKKLRAATAKRREAAALLRRAIAELAVPGLQIPFSDPRGEPVHHLFVILLPPGMERNRFRANLAERGVQSSVHYPLLNRLSLFRKAVPGKSDPGLPVASGVADRLVTLPMGPHLTADSIAWIAESVEKAAGA